MTISAVNMTDYVIIVAEAVISPAFPVIDPAENQGENKPR